MDTALQSSLGGAFAFTAKQEFPGLSDNQRNWIFDNTKNEDEQMKKQKQYDLYKQVLPVTIANKKMQERIDAKQELLYATQTEKDETKKNTQKLTLKLADLADTMRADALKKGYDLTDKTDDILVGQLVNKAPNGQQMLTDYINGVNEDIFIKTGLKEAPVVEEDKNASSLGEFLGGKPIDTSREVSQFLDPLNMKATGGADPTTALNLVGKSILNLIPNTVSFVKGVGSMIFHPKQTVEGLKSLGQGIIDQSQGQTDTPQAQMVAGMWDNIKETVTDPQKLGEWITNNPLDIITVISPKSVVTAGKTALNATVKGATKAAKVLGKGTTKASEFVSAQAFGVTPSTIRTIVSNPKLYSEVEKGVVDSEKMLSSLGTKIDERIAKISETGKEYQNIKKVADITPPNVVDVLSKRGITIDESGKLNFTNTNMADTADMNAIQRAYDMIAKDYTSQGGKINVINIRGKLDDLINYESKTTSKGQGVVKELRGAIDTKAKAEIPGLSELDATYGEQAKLLKSIKKDFLNPDGTFKDGAMSRISNLTKKGNEAKLERVKELVPGIEDNINAIKAFEDVTLAGGQKVGAYFRGAGTAGVGYAAGGPIGALVGLLITSPQVATNLLKGLGYTKQFISSITKSMKLGIKLTPSQVKTLEQGLKGAAVGGVIKKDLSSNQ